MGVGYQLRAREATRVKIHPPIGEGAPVIGRRVPAVPDPPELAVLVMELRSWLAQPQRWVPNSSLEAAGSLLTWWAERPDLADQERKRGTSVAERLSRQGLEGRLAGEVLTADVSELAAVSAGLSIFGERTYGTLFTIEGRRLAECLALHILRRPARWWKTDPCALRRAVQCLLLAEAHGAREARPAARLLIDRLVPRQAPDGSFPTQIDPTRVVLRSHLQAAEGLWIFGVSTNDQAAVKAARKAMAWAGRRQLPSGGFPAMAERRSLLNRASEQLEVTARAVRLGLLLENEQIDLGAGLGRLVLAVRTRSSSPTVNQRWARMEPDIGSMLVSAQALDIASRGGQACTWPTMV